MRASHFFFPNTKLKKKKIPVCLLLYFIFKLHFGFLKTEHQKLGFSKIQTHLKMD